MSRTIQPSAGRPEGKDVNGSTIGRRVGRASETLDFRPLTVRIGAEIHGVDLADPLPEAVRDAVHQAIVAHRVVFFRNQRRLDREGQVRFARQFGALTTAHPTIPAVDDVPPLLGLDSLTGGQADEWHTDVTFVERPPNFSFLRAVVLPEVGGDTLWASTVAAYDSLRPELRQLAEQLRAVHTNNYDYVKLDVAALTAELSPARAAYLRQFVSTVYETEHPLVRVHPDTGERALLLGNFAQRVIGYTTSQSADLIRLFQAFVTRPENTVRWRWKEGDVAVWDNRSTQHFATFDYPPAQRKVDRVTTVGTVPVGVDGRPSRALKGDASAYNAEANRAA
jgi:alpha-ketoglutarate-dependent sulfate ester dioxygenase